MILSTELFRRPAEETTGFRSRLRKANPLKVVSSRNSRKKAQQNRVSIVMPTAGHSAVSTSRNDHVAETTVSAQPSASGGQLPPAWSS
ncbi:Oidioi.mRNA.OKI2018_I69.YSR.g17180.t1.cds [Oikopleura dioica]|uniref:Oidioi.mRNA.OKI2018_I69.YSR.g17180.t1.cds n=1 Tax=Oikopleura dioica TaxID=34765 RepID=A0ABN7SM62_OIKDI|nr:Oidioi.mRNA.OKI2018_I69.YSR.g17180.t1.cds [Oikopleura dioica]